MVIDCIYEVSLITGLRVSTYKLNIIISMSFLKKLIFCIWNRTNTPVKRNANSIIHASMKNPLTITFLPCSYAAFSRMSFDRSCTNATIHHKLGCKKHLNKRIYRSQGSKHEHGKRIWNAGDSTPHTGCMVPVVYIGELHQPHPGNRDVRLRRKASLLQKVWGYSEGNIISYGYQPNHSEWHMIKPVQVQ